MMNLENIQARSRIIKLIREWFDEHEFAETHTPRLVGLPGQEPYLEPFFTEVSSPSLQAEHTGSPLRPTSCRLPAYLITSPEYMMKRLLALGMDKIYDLGPCFRNNEPWDGTHDPEFLLLEWYRRDAEIEDLMRDTEEMMQFVQSHLPPTTYHLPVFPFRRLTVEDAWRRYAGIELAPLLEDRETMAQVCRERGQTVQDSDTWDDLYFKIFLTDIEPKLGWSDVEAHGMRHQPLPTFLYRYPRSMAALSRLSQDDPRWADRVELYVGDLELANGFAELSDPDEQRKRFVEERALRQAQGKKTWDLDERFLAALPKMGNAAGIAFGVDRLVMLLMGVKSINDILPASARERFAGT